MLAFLAIFLEIASGRTKPESSPMYSANRMIPEANFAMSTNGSATFETGNGTIGSAANHWRRLQRGLVQG